MNRVISLRTAEKLIDFVTEKHWNGFITSSFKETADLLKIKWQQEWVDRIKYLVIKISGI